MHKHIPPKFKGGLEASEAEKWIKRMETIFSAVPCISPLKVQVAITYLEDEARDWWDSVRPANISQMTWEDFKEMFYDHFFPKELRMEKQFQFYSLRQDDMHEDLFITKFIELVKYVPRPENVNYSLWKAQQLLYRAKPELQ